MKPPAQYPPTSVRKPPAPDKTLPSPHPKSRQPYRSPATAPTAVATQLPPPAAQMSSGSSPPQAHSPARKPPAPVRAEESFAAFSIARSHLSIKSAAATVTIRRLAALQKRFANKQSADDTDSPRTKLPRRSHRAA